MQCVTFGSIVVHHLPLSYVTFGLMIVVHHLPLSMANQPMIAQSNYFEHSDRAAEVVQVEFRYAA
jgi:hypothetical protein